MNITFIFGRCRRSSAAVTAVKYECDSRNLTGTFAWLKIFAYREINKQSFSNPHPEFLPPHSNESPISSYSLVMVLYIQWRWRRTGCGMPLMLHVRFKTSMKPVSATAGTTGLTSPERSRSLLGQTTAVNIVKKSMILTIVTYQYIFLSFN